jgi:tetratricopeptide (TPR) repeat protein
MIGGVILLSACKQGPQQAKQQTTHNDSTAVKQVDTITDGIKRFTDFITAHPNASDPYWRRGILEAAQKNYGGAMLDYQHAIKLDSTKALYFYSLADLDFTIGHTRDAKDVFEHCIKLDPKNTDAILRLAELYFLVKKYPDAMKYVSEAIKVNQYIAKEYFLKGMIYLETHDTVKAVSSMQTAVEQNTKYYEAYIQLGLIFSRKHSPLAIDYFNDAINLQPRSLEPYYDEGMHYQNMGDFDNAVKMYREILQMDSTNKQVLYNMGYIAYAHDKDYKESIVYFDKAVRSDTTYFMAYYARGICYEQLGMPDRALLDYSHAMYLNPNFTPAVEAFKEVKEKLHK